MSCEFQLAEELREQGFRVTPQRAIILETISHQGGHLSVQQVYNEARLRLPGLNLATVYRAVESLHEAGLVDVYSTGTEPVRFSLRDPDNVHGHMICRCCGADNKLEAPSLHVIQDHIQSSYGFEVDTHHLLLEGYCPACLEKD
ncbi:MAG: Fur family transcriptional regulator [Anaerolineales bacterium]|jgi:Fur family ferric uptake transcriptional regulator